MAELVDAPDLGSGTLCVEVRVLFRAPTRISVLVFVNRKSDCNQPIVNLFEPKCEKKLEEPEFPKGERPYFGLYPKSGGVTHCQNFNNHNELTLESYNFQMI